MIVTTAAEFAGRELRPRGREIDRAGRVPDDLCGRLGELGFFGLLRASEDDGDVGEITAARVAFELAAACASTGLLVALHNFAGLGTVARLARDGVAPVHLDDLASGSMRCTAAIGRTLSVSRAGDDLVLEGTLAGVPFASDADLAFVLSPDSTLLAVPRDAAGISFGPPQETMGLRGAAFAPLTFDACRLPADAIVGDGEALAARFATAIHLASITTAIGIARAAFERAVAYSLERSTFGSPLGEKQAIQFKLADMATRIDAARLLGLRVALGVWSGEETASRAHEAARARRFATRVAMEVTFDALQVYGAYGYSEEYEMERHYRDARAVDLFEWGDEELA